MNASSPLRPFHVAFPVTSLEKTRHFFTEILGCTTGRTSDRWIDFNLFGHQVTAHLVEKEAHPSATNPVDGKSVPASHWGVILGWEEWHQLSERLQHRQISFLIEPYIRFEGEVGEQATLFLKDPSENVLEFKAFKEDSFIFKK